MKGHSFLEQFREMVDNAVHATFYFLRHTIAYFSSFYFRHKDSGTCFVKQKYSDNNDQLLTFYCNIRHTKVGAQAKRVWHCIEADLVCSAYAHLK